MKPPFFGFACLVVLDFFDSWVFWRDWKRREREIDARFDAAVQDALLRSVRKTLTDRAETAQHLEDHRQ